MKLTARDSGTGYYAWTEQMFDANGAFMDLPGGRVGTVNGLAGATATILPALEMNGQTPPSFPWYTRAERAIESATVGVYYQYALGGSTLFAFFTLPSTLATTDASKASCTVNSYWGGASPGSTITVYNMVASSNYVFSGASGHKGLAVYDSTNAKFWIIQMECP